jgi:hypothetical protein
VFDSIHADGSGGEELDVFQKYCFLAQREDSLRKTTDTNPKYPCGHAQ